MEPKLLTFREWEKAHPWPTRGALGHIARERHKNQSAACFVETGLQRGKFLIREQAFLEWINKGPLTHKTRFIPMVDWGKYYHYPSVNTLRNLIKGHPSFYAKCVRTAYVSGNDIGPFMGPNYGRILLDEKATWDWLGEHRVHRTPSGRTTFTPHPNQTITFPDHPTPNITWEETLPEKIVQRIQDAGGNIEINKAGQIIITPPRVAKTLDLAGGGLLTEGPKKAIGYGFCPVGSGVCVHLQTVYGTRYRSSFCLRDFTPIDVLISPIETNGGCQHRVPRVD